MEKNTHKKRWIVAAKCLLILCAFSWVFHKSDSEQIVHYLEHIHPLAFLAALLLLFIAQIISAFRNRFYFKSTGITVSMPFMTGLYFTGMLFNTVLPGGIGGDGYKIYAIGKYNQSSRLQALRACVSDRASGLFAILLLIGFFAPFTSFYSTLEYATSWAFFFLIMGTIGYFIAARLLLKESPLTAITALFFSLPIQLIGGAAIVLVLLSSMDGVTLEYVSSFDYITLFFISSIASVIPISIGGAGLRELTFLYGAHYFNISPELGIAMAIAFFALNFLCSLSGLLFWHRLNELYHR